MESYIFLLRPDKPWLVEMPKNEELSQKRAERHPEDILFFADLVAPDQHHFQKCTFCPRRFSPGVRMVEHTTTTHKLELAARGMLT